MKAYDCTKSEILTNIYKSLAWILSNATLFLKYLQNIYFTESLSVATAYESSTRALCNGLSNVIPHAC